MDRMPVDEISRTHQRPEAWAKTPEEFILPCQKNKNNRDRGVFFRRGNIPSRTRGLSLSRDCLVTGPQGNYHCHLAERHGSVAAPHREPIESGIDISHPRPLRVVDNRAQHLIVAMFNGLPELLSCRVQDLN
ncbi:hypothetical protein [Noviherbaspirillum galbum]|uniref:Uncharacterized protein n=1 Tax=Noviherbaspirillum galbum TaxID=2709383 RepID=A0A6B3SXM7_9BURK|nr:hypothetical protein [Noviherbaspirillum galbum]NEX63916.1 hypothetical protein [Noviherbaspirillum galbum]